jgi:hypothetical protein
MTDTDPTPTMADRLDAELSALLDRPLSVGTVEALTKKPHPGRALYATHWPCCCGDWHPSESVCPVGGWIT